MCAAEEKELVCRSKGICTLYMNKLQHHFFSQFGEGHREPLVELTWNDPLLYLFSPSTTTVIVTWLWRGTGEDRAFMEVCSACGGSFLFVNSEVFIAL